MPSRRTLLTTLAALPLATVPALAASRPSIVATTGMIADAVAGIAGDRVNLTTLMGPGVDPHGYRQTRSDIVALTRADLVLCNGLHLEAQMTEFLDRLAARTRVVAVAEAVPENLVIHRSTRSDPHVWMVPSLWRHAVGAVEMALTALLPDQTDALRANAQAYLAQMDRLQTYAQDMLTGVPEAARVLVTAHDAFGYFGRDFGFQVEGIQGISTESEAGLNRIRSLTDLLVDRQIGAVFVESSVSDRNLRALIEGAAARGHRVTVGGELYSDAMGAPGTYEATYVGMIDHNVTTIAGALGADVPARGMTGRLGA
ncbi:zinc ABC transporter substrate-binding protein [Mesobacterium sp. TK19101]|uniref:Zinc ABC transporter substrate-binding protein n=1 Tax=Mesobacterium hydrothermale TaxID=3111907 RepID=A0ABU6HH45_9RHOB|nr:zinc ABC transporter substrate-binding protein [Mesobacterium sp. TK19101]MEC3861779.1 zinc ABC transporter substrate-binding protein [Mesobacterium sp. TK19101]